MEQTVAKRGIDVLKSVMNAPSIQEQFKNALNENSGAFVASVIDLYNSDNSLQRCDPKAVVMEALKAAVLKLPINKALGFAYIVCFNNNVKQANGSWLKVPTPTFMPGYKGYIQLAMRTGSYRTINADIVYEGEVNKVNKLSGEINFDGERVSDKVIGYFCYFELLNGFKKTFYSTVEEMAKHAKRFSPGLKGDAKTTVESLIKLSNSNLESSAVGWTGNFSDMALKTTIRHLLSKYGYLSIEMQTMISNDETHTTRDNEIDNLENKNIDITDVAFFPVDGNESKQTTFDDAAPKKEDLPY